MQRYVMELIGTFFLVLVIGLNVAHAGPLAPIGIGLGLTALVYMGGPLSGAHYNPAVSVGLWLRGVLPSPDLLPYMAAQLVGALAGAQASHFLQGDLLLVRPAENVTLAQAGTSELLFTFLLMYVIFHVAVARSVRGNSYYGLAIGLTVMAGAFSVGAISGAALNPAVTLGPLTWAWLQGTSAWEHVLVYLAAQFLGAGLANFLFAWQEPSESAPVEISDA